MAVALCRCMNIPARYATGYLGDIGVPAAPYPMDFSAWFEVYLEGGWAVVLKQEHGWKVVGLSVAVVIAGNVAWLVSKIFERRFVEVWTKK